MQGAGRQGYARSIAEYSGEGKLFQLGFVQGVDAREYRVFSGRIPRQEADEAQHGSRYKRRRVKPLFTAYMAFGFSKHYVERNGLSYSGTSVFPCVEALMNITAYKYA